MNKRIAIPMISAIAVSVLAIGILSIPMSACACGEQIPGTVKYHWVEMSYLERARYYWDGTIPFDETGEQL